jgi:pyridoxine 4-dehydrogenase
VTGNGRELGGCFALGPWRVRRDGYGAMQLAGDGVFGPPRDRDEALRVLHAAVAAGVDHIDTAQYYGAGTVNELIREALYPYPDGLAIVSKVAARGGAVDAPPRFDEPNELRQGIEDNLATLGAGRLAAVNLRMADPSETPGKRFDAQLAALARAREEGLIDGIGLSNVSRRHLLRAAAKTEIVCVQNLFNLADQRSQDVLTECEARKIAFVPFCPLGLPGEVRRWLLAHPVLAVALFTEDTHFVVYMDTRNPEPTQDLHGREALAPVFDALNAYVATMHFNGQSMVELDGDRATGESYCLAHHLTEAEDGSRTLLVASIRYLDTFVKQDGAWLFAERRLMVNWTDTRPSVS